MWRGILAAALAVVLAGWVIASLTIAVPGFVPLLGMFALWFSRPLPTWDEELLTLLQP